MVTISDYQPGWPDEFRREAARIRAALGDLALRIDHIGSTAVAGLAAKDILDIQVSVAALRPAVIAALQAAGYQYRKEIDRDHVPPGGASAAEAWRKLYFREAPATRVVHIHVRVAGQPNQCYPLLFRDYLRAHPASAAAYGELKRRLAANLADSDSYPDVKDPAVDLIYLAAEDWAAATGWQPAASDA
ncbi:MAG: GrpB family protein [Anaerolineales bacterium]|nr:GrpB family protein [Anaerolineales bacterium]